MAIQASLGLLRAVPPAWGVGARGHSIAISACARAGQGQEACDLLHNFYAATGERPDLQTCATVMGKWMFIGFITYMWYSIVWYMMLI
jgi:pentatricopeptide repeat protein